MGKVTAGKWMKRWVLWKNNLLTRGCGNIKNQHHMKYAQSLAISGENYWTFSTNGWIKAHGQKDLVHVFVLPLNT